MGLRIREITSGGRTNTVEQWAKLLGLKPHAIYSRMRRGDSIERCLRPLDYIPRKRPRTYVAPTPVAPRPLPTRPAPPSLSERETEIQVALLEQIKLGIDRHEYDSLGLLIRAYKSFPRDPVPATSPYVKPTARLPVRKNDDHI